MNDSTYQEITNLRLSRLNIFIVLSTLCVLLVTLTVLLIIATPLKEYIPGYGEVNSRNELIELRLKTDSLEQLAAANDKYLQNINNIIDGNVGNNKVEKPQKIETEKVDTKSINPLAPEDAALRAEEENKEKYWVKNSKQTNGAGGKISAGSKISDFYFFTPLKGKITSLFNANANHYGVDIAAAKNEPVKAALDGIVIMSDWTNDNGYCISIQHANGLVTCYKHNSILYKKTGNFVKAGDVISVVGNSGELSKGPHLHFELWYNGMAVNPKDFINFN